MKRRAIRWEAGLDWKIHPYPAVRRVGRSNSRPKVRAEQHPAEHVVERVQCRGLCSSLEAVGFQWPARPLPNSQRTNATNKIVLGARLRSRSSTKPRYAKTIRIHPCQVNRKVAPPISSNTSKRREDRHAKGAPGEPVPVPLREARRRWAELLRRTFEIDPLQCPRCGEAMRIVVFITQPRVIDRILDSLRRTATAPRRSRAPPRRARRVRAAAGSTSA